MLHTFLDFEIDEARCELRFQGAPIATQGRVFDLIVYLLRARERVVSRDELMNALWHGNVVSDAAISQVIMLARKALNDEGESQRVIKTVRGRGIRFVADVASAEAAAAGRSAEVCAQSAPLPALVEYEVREPLLGRSTELRLLLERLGRTELGQGSLVLIEGEPGVGKTALAEQLSAAAQERGFDVIWGRAWEGGGAPPFWPWIQVLRTIAQREGSEQLREWLGGGGSEFAPLLPEFGSQTQPRSEALSTDLEGARARFRQFDVLSRMLRHLAGRESSGARASSDGGTKKRPWLILLDDLHAADDASVQLVRFLMPDLGELGLMLVGTYRGLECASKGSLSALAESCSDSILHLRGLTPADVSELLTRKLGQPVPGRLAAALHNVSAGNPLLLSELCSRLGDDVLAPKGARFDAEMPLPELAHLADFALPERIASAVQKHLEQLPEATRTALAAASALGREFSPPLLAKLLARSEAELSELLAPAIRRAVLRRAASPGCLLFSHVLVCNAIYAELPPQRRLSLHGRIGELLEQGSSPAHPPLHELAHHYHLAGSDGYRDKALHYAERAAEQACSVMAHESGAVLYDRAIALAELQQESSEHLHTLLCAAGRAWYRSGDMERAALRYDRAATLARAENAPERLAEAVVLCCCSQRGAMLHDPERHQQMREALALLPPGDSAVRARLLSCSTLGLRSPDTLAARRNATLAAVEMARRLGDPEVLLWTLDAQHFVLWGAAPPEEMVLIAQEMIALSRATDNGETLLDALLWCGSDYIDMGDAVGMQRIREEFAEAAERYGSPWHRCVALGSDVLQAAVFGDLPRARALSRQMLLDGRRMQDALAEPFYELRTMFFDFHECRDRVPAESPFALIDAPACVPPDYRAFWALTWADRGYREAARNMLTQTLAHERLLLDALRRPTLAVMGQVAVMLEDRAAIEAVYRLLRPDAGRHLLLQACVYLGPIDHYLGVLAAALGQRELAREHFEQALGSSLSATLSAETTCEYGRLLCARRETYERGHALLISARESAERFGLRRLEERVQVALAMPLKVSQSSSVG
jgi:DNA-binding winged helix-turn-helix (wHTH) protein/tetratricopeptide (TPR) repeat protein